MVSTHTRSKEQRVHALLKSKEAKDKRAYELIHGPTQYDAIPKHEAFNTVGWYYDQDEQRHFTTLLGTERWMDIQERMERSIQCGAYTMADTSGNEPLRSNMEQQLQRMELFNLGSEFKTHLFFELSHANYAVYVALLQKMEQDKIENDITEIAQREREMMSQGEPDLRAFVTKVGEPTIGLPPRTRKPQWSRTR
jgi:hypothetical protein